MEQFPAEGYFYAMKSEIYFAPLYRHYLSVFRGKFARKPQIGSLDRVADLKRLKWQIYAYLIKHIAHKYITANPVKFTDVTICYVKK